MKRTLGKQPEDYMNESLNMVDKTEHPTWLNIVWTQVIHWYLLEDFQILTKGFNHCKFKRRICEAFLIKKHQPTLNAQEQSVTL